MLDWFSNVTGAAGLDRMRGEFSRMLEAGHHVFDVATSALLGGADLEAIRADLFKTEKSINKSVRQLRREIVVHSTVHGPHSFPGCLVLMSVAKDVERIGDYSKNLFDLAAVSPIVQDTEWRSDLTVLKDRILQLMAGCRSAFYNSDREAALNLIIEAEKIEDHCDHQIHRILTEEPPKAAVYALAFRFFKRVASHTFNILTSIVQPVDRIDFAKKLPLPKTEKT